jgi:hypothetical protein
MSPARAGDARFGLDAGACGRPEEPIPEGQFAPSSAIPGTLEVDEAGTTNLKLEAFLARGKSGPLGALFRRRGESRLIQGMLAGSNLYVLLSELIPNGANASSVGPSSEAWFAHRCLASPAPFSPKTEPSFGSIELGLAGYEEWLHLKSIIVTKSKSSVMARYVRPRQLKWKLSTGSLHLKLGVSHPMPGEYATASFHEVPSLLLERKTVVGLEDALALLLRIQDLLVLLTDCDRKPEFPTLRATPNSPPIRLFYTRLPDTSEQLRWHQCWIRFPQLVDSFGDVVESWLAKHSSIGPGFNLYVASRRDQLYGEHRFATLVWGLESLHRRTYPASDNKALQAKIHRIVAQIARPKDKKWAERQLEGAGEPTLATRLKDLFRQLPLKFDQARMESFTQEVARRRNELSHFGGMRHTDGYESFIDQVLRFNEALDLLYHATLLLQIGIPETTITWWFMEGFRSYAIGEILKAAGIPLVKPKSSENHAN